MTVAAPPPISELAKLDPGDLIDRYRGGANRLDRRLLDLDPEQADTFFRPEAGVGRWSCRVLVGHLADAELVYSHRMRRVVGEDRPVFGVWDENAFIDNGVYGSAAPPAAAVAVIHTLRLWTADWLAGLTPAQRRRSGLHPEYGELTVLRLVAFATWHVEHHAGFLAKKLDRLLGPAR